MMDMGRKRKTFPERASYYPMPDFVAKLQWLLARESQTVEDFAGGIGISRQALTAYLTYKSIPGIDKLKMICENYHVSADWMLGLKKIKDVRKYCENCRWRSDDFTSVCVNDASDHLADFVAADCVCECWEPAEDAEDGETGP